MANYHIIRFDSLIKTMSICDTLNSFQYKLSTDGSVITQSGDILLGYLNEPICEFRYIFQVVDVTDGTISLLKLLEVASGVHINLEDYDEILPTSYEKELITITEELYTAISKQMTISLSPAPKKMIKLGKPLQVIYFGTPGSGKSYTVKEFVKNQGGKMFRTTFHPDSDYSTFVGSYKPIKTDSGLTYEFVPQAFTDAYVWAWKNPGTNVFLVIEEINRGNCAQIFGDLFQLLDRNKNGLSEYPVKADKDLYNYLKIDTVLGKDHDGITDGELKLPSNLSILATMNTSDQSLFPMDSAFKRRWAWEYVPIDADCPDSQFKITIGDQVYKWASFLTQANKHIHKLSDSEDKQMGNFFIKSDIEVEEFKSKVMFYLWSEVCKEYEKSGSFFKYIGPDNTEVEFTFNSLFPTGDETNEILQKFMSKLGVEKDEDATNKENNATVFVNRLVELGLDRVASTNISLNGYPLVGKTQPHGHAFRRKGEYYIQTTVEDKDGMISDILSMLE